MSRNRANAVLQLPTPLIADIVGRIASMRAKRDIVHKSRINNDDDDNDEEDEDDIVINNTGEHWQLITFKLITLFDCLINNAEEFNEWLSIRELMRELFVRREGNDPFSPLVLHLHKQADASFVVKHFRALCARYNDPGLLSTFARYLVLKVPNGYVEAFQVVDQLLSADRIPITVKTTCADVYRQAIAAYFELRLENERKSVEFVKSLFANELQEKSISDAKKIMEYGRSKMIELFLEANRLYKDSTKLRDGDHVEVNSHAYGGRVKLYYALADGLFQTECEKDRAKLLHRLDAEKTLCGRLFFDEMVEMRDLLDEEIERYGIVERETALGDIDKFLIKLLNLCLDQVIDSTLSQGVRNALVPLKLLYNKGTVLDWSQLRLQDLRLIKKTFTDDESQLNKLMQSTYRNIIFTLLNLSRLAQDEASIDQANHFAKMWLTKRADDFVGEFWRGLLSFVKFLDAPEGSSANRNIKRSIKSINNCQTLCKSGTRELVGLLRIRSVLMSGTGLRRLCALDSKRVLDNNVVVDSIGPLEPQWFAGKLMDSEMRREIDDLQMLSNHKEWMFVFSIGSYKMAVATNSKMEIYKARANQYPTLECLIGFAYGTGALAFLVREPLGG